MSTFFFFCLIQIIQTFSYYLSSSPLTWEYAGLYCKEHCDSDLVSIHSLQDQQNIIDFIINDDISTLSTFLQKDVWIGLYSIANDYRWIDDTPFNYGNDTTGGIEPWNTGYPDNILTNNAVYMSCTLNHTLCPWINVDGSDRLLPKLFLCNNCNWNKLTKYIVFDEDKSNSGAPDSNANNFCISELNTSLASIHSDSDNEEVIFLCKYGAFTGISNPVPDDCHIGAHDRLIETKYQWSDGTTFDYGLNTTGGVYPWEIEQPDASDCVQLDNLNYLWICRGCSYNLPVICNKPSQLCYRNRWTQVDGLSDIDWSWNNINCGVINNPTDMTQYSQYQLDIGNKTWRYLTLEYMYSINNTLNPGNEIFAGVMIDITDVSNTETFSYYIGIHKRAEAITMFFNGSSLVSGSDIASFYNISASDYYSLRIELNGNGIFVIKLNDDDSYIASQNILNELPIKYYIKSISMRNIGAVITAKWLYINGEFTIIEPIPSPAPYPTAMSPFSYYLSSSKLTWMHAQMYCKEQCDSDLVSIHSMEEQQNLIDYIMNDDISTYSTILTKDVWIGLYSVANEYRWVDNTLFNYGSNLSQDGKPWYNGYPDGIVDNKAVYMSCSVNSTLCPWINVDGYDTETPIAKLFLCNSCNWNKLTKYIVIDEAGKSNNEGESICLNQFNTSLASIHTLPDNREAIYLCKHGSFDNNGDLEQCHIGLYDGNGVDEGVYKWPDQTTFDFGTNVNANIYPWGSVNSNDCVHLIPPEYRWENKGCTTSASPICNKPSQLCFKSRWHHDSDIGDINDWKWGNDNIFCDVINKPINPDQWSQYTMNITGYKWRHLALDYMYNINDTSLINVQDIFTGIMITIIGYTKQDVHNYYMGLHINKDTINLFFDSNNITHGIDIKSVYNISNYYSLRIDFNEDSIVTLKLNNNDSYILPQDISNDLPVNYYIKSISMRNIGATVISKYLYMNGESDFFDTNSPTPMPTGVPTTTFPSKQPITAIPTQYPTKPPSDIPTIFPTNHPSKTPTKSPSNQPTEMPTISPSIAPTEEHIIKITDFPSKAPIMVTDTTQITNTKSDNQDASNKDDDSINIFLIIGIVIGSVLLILIIIIFILIKYRKNKRDNVICDETKIHIAMTSPDNNIETVKIDDPDNVIEGEGVPIKTDNINDKVDDDDVNIDDLSDDMITPMGRDFNIVTPGPDAVLLISDQVDNVQNNYINNDDTDNDNDDDDVVNKLNNVITPDGVTTDGTVIENDVDNIQIQNNDDDHQVSSDDIIENMDTQQYQTIV